MQRARIGVAMATYNGRAYLREQLDSLLAQTLVPDTIVCCDDGSADGTFEWLREYVHSTGQESRFLLIQNDKNLGYAQNFYKALRHCDADILFLADQDDIWDVRKIETMATVFANQPNCILLSCAHTIVNSQGLPIRSMRYGQKAGSGKLLPVSEREIVHFFRWPGMCMALRREFFLEIAEAAAEIQAPHDRVLALLAASQNGMYYLNTVLCAHRFHTDNSGGEENSARVYLAKEFKLKELCKSMEWITAELAAQSSFSPVAVKALREYSDFLSLRLSAIEKQSFLALCKTARCRTCFRPKAFLGDLACLLLKNNT